MEKRKVKITIISEESKQEYTTIGSYDKEKEILTYQEKQDIVTDVEVNIKEKMLIRDNKDLNMKYLFALNKETTNKIYLKELDKNLDIKIKTTKYNYDNKKIEIEYILIDSGDIVNYQVEY